jgi:hypothetical protein
VPTHGLLNVVSAPHLGEASTYRPVFTTASKQKAATTTTTGAGGSKEGGDQEEKGEEGVPADNSDSVSGDGREEEGTEVKGEGAVRPAESVNAKMEDDLKISDEDLAKAHQAMVHNQAVIDANQKLLDEVRRGFGGFWVLAGAMLWGLWGGRAGRR